MSFPVPEALAGVLRIVLAALRANYRLLTEIASPTACGAVVKADAYGLGRGPVSRALAAEGCRDFIVAHLFEALGLRPHLPEDAHIYILNGVLPGGENLAADQGFVPFLNSIGQVRHGSRTASARGQRLPAVLQCDTAMSRLGLAPGEIAALHGDDTGLAQLDIIFVASHLASAYEPESPQNAAQLDVAGSIARQFPGAPFSLASSAGILLGAECRRALARPGIALYGRRPRAVGPNPFRPVVRLEVRVIQIRSIQAGIRVGYSGTFDTKRPIRLATLAAGYADGIPRSLSSRGAAYFGGIRLPIVGRVSMDSVMVDVSALDPDSLALGSHVEILGEHQTLEDLASAVATNSYEILTGLGGRFHRSYDHDQPEPTP